MGCHRHIIIMDHKIANGSRRHIQAQRLPVIAVPLGNMEAVQFHPTGIVPAAILVTEGCRGDGGYLLDKNLHRFMPDYEPVKKEIASRDVVSRWMLHHIRQGFGVDSPYGPHLWLDIRHLGPEHICTNLREVHTICQNFLGIDCVEALIPVRPTQHYSMGGVRTNKDGEAYNLKGLFAAGEAACWDLHGFNRLGGNSLAETIVAGMVVGERVAQFAQEQSLMFPFSLVEDAMAVQAQRLADLRSRKNGAEDAFSIRHRMEDTLLQNVGIFRTAASSSPHASSAVDVTLFRNSVSPRRLSTSTPCSRARSRSM